MPSTRSIRRAITAAIILSLISISVLADTIRLKDGSIIKGKIIRFAGGKFSVEIGDGSRKRDMTFSADEIESIQFDGPETSYVRQSTQFPAKNDTIIKVSTNSPDSSEKTSSPPKVITTDSTAAVKTLPAPPKATPTDTTASSGTQPKTNLPAANGSKTQPIELNIKVLADSTANGWTSTGWVVRKGQRIRITGDGVVSLGNGKTSTPAGLPDLADDQKLLKSVATGALLAVIGDDNNDFIYVGAEREFTASRDGTLFLGVNEGNLDDNSGSFDVKVQIMPDSE